MQAPDGSSAGARAALLRLSIDLRLHPTIVAVALEYAYDNHLSFPSASQALCFSIVRQGYCVNMQILDVALQRLRTNFGGVFGALAVQHPMGQWLTQPSVQGYGQWPNSVQASPASGNAVGCPTASNAPPIASWPMPQHRRPSMLSKVQKASAGAHSGNNHDLPSMGGDTKFTQY